MYRTKHRKKRSNKQITLSIEQRIELVKEINKLIDKFKDFPYGSNKSRKRTRKTRKDKK